MKYLPYLLAMLLIPLIAFAGREAEKLPPGQVELQSQDTYAEKILDSDGNLIYEIGTDGGVTVYNSGSIPVVTLLKTGVSAIAINILGSAVPVGSQVTSWIGTGTSTFYKPGDSVSFAVGGFSSTVTAVGRMGAGVSVPARQLHVKDTIQISNDTYGYAVNQGSIISFSSGGYLYAMNLEENQDIRFYLSKDTGSLNALYLTASGAIMGYASGVSSPGAGTTTFLLMANSGVTPPGAIVGGAGLFAYNDELYAMDAAGNVTRLSAHDKETGESVHYSFNIYTGIGKTIWLEQGNKTDIFAVQRVNPEECARSAWIAKWIEDNTVKTKTANGGDKFIVPTLAQAQVEAAKTFNFKWSTMPKYIRDAWGK